MTQDRPAVSVPPLAGAECPSCGATLICCAVCGDYRDDHKGCDEPEWYVTGARAVLTCKAVCYPSDAAHPAEYDEVCDRCGGEDE